MTDDNWVPTGKLRWIPKAAAYPGENLGMGTAYVLQQEYAVLDEWNHCKREDIRWATIPIVHEV